MTKDNQFTVQFSEDGSLYYVREMAFKHAWLSVEANPDIPTVPRLAMPFSGLCRYDRAGGNSYYRIFYNQSYFNVRLGKSEAREASDPLVLDYADAAAFAPLEEATEKRTGTEAGATTKKKSNRKSETARSAS